MKTKYQIFDAEGTLVREGRMVLLDPKDLKEAPVEQVWSEWYNWRLEHYVESYVYAPHPKVVLNEGERVVFS